MSVDRMVEVLQRQDPPLSAGQLGQVAARLLRASGLDGPVTEAFWAEFHGAEQLHMLSRLEAKTKPASEPVEAPAEEPEPAEEPKPATKRK